MSFLPLEHLYNVLEVFRPPNAIRGVVDQGHGPVFLIVAEPACVRLEFGEDDAVFPMCQDKIWEAVAI